MKKIEPKNRTAVFLERTVKVTAAEIMEALGLDPKNTTFSYGFFTFHDDVTLTFIERSPR